MKLPATFRIALLLVLVVPAGVVLAHQYQSGDPVDQINPGPLGMANFGKIVSGEFNGDFVRDAVVMDSNVPKLVVWPESHKNAHSIGTDVHDMDVMSGIVSGKDVLLTVNWDGLQMWEFDTANDEWDVTTIADYASAWGDAILVRTAEVDGSNGKDIVGVAANGNDVLVMLNNGNGTFSAGTGYTNTYDIYDMVVVNWRETNDTAGTDEIATFTWNNYQVREPSGGQLLKTAPWTVSRIYGCKVKDAGYTTERLAMIAASGGNDWLATIGTGGTSDGPTSIGPAGVVAMTSGDANNDGDSEIFLSITSEKKFWMFTNNGTTAPTFTFASPTKFSYGPSSRNPALNHAGLAADDFDGDGYLDILAPAQGHLTGAITAYGTLVLKQLGLGAPANLKVGVSSVMYKESWDPEGLQFTLTQPTTTMSVPGGCTAKLRVDVWKTPGGLEGESVPEAYASVVQPLPSTQSTFALILPDGYIPFSGPTGSHDTFSLIFRQVAVNGSNVVVDEGPALDYMWVPQNEWGNFSQASDVSGSMITGREHEDQTPGGGGGTGPSVPGPGDNITPKR